MAQGKKQIEMMVYKQFNFFYIYRNLIQKSFMQILVLNWELWTFDYKCIETVIKNNRDWGRKWHQMWLHYTLFFKCFSVY